MSCDADRVSIYVSEMQIADNRELMMKLLIPLQLKNINEESVCLTQQRVVFLFHNSIENKCVSLVNITGYGCERKVF